MGCLYLSFGIKQTSDLCDLLKTTIFAIDSGKPRQFKNEYIMAEKRRYPVGLQTFEKVVMSDCVYIDKTEYVYKLSSSSSQNFFLSRPRRFGKSLFVSTLKAYFEGRKELFKGLAIEKLEKEWIQYPVIRLDLSAGKYYELDKVKEIFNMILNRYEREYGLEEKDDWGFSPRLTSIIEAAYRQTGHKVVVLIDEYDAPMLDSIHKPELQEQIRERVRDLFSPLKAQSDYLHKVFLTGISKFSQLSVFSELNNLSDMTFDTEYEGVCGITEAELLTQMKPDIEWLAQSMEYTYDETVAELKRRYDGYHFCDKMTDIYNPWSLIYAFEKGKIGDYWFSTGTPTMLINVLRKNKIDMPVLEGMMADLSRFNAPTERITDPIPVLFQSGYLTLKSYDSQRDRYTLGFPNEEVYRGFAKCLYKYYANVELDEGLRTRMDNAYLDFKFGDTGVDDFLDAIRQWYASIPYSITDRNQNGQLYQSLLYALLVAVGADVHAEQQTSDGRMDISLKMSDAIYILEFKYNKKTRKAIEQIVKKDYAVVFASDPRPVYAVPMNVDAKKRTIEKPQVERLK